MKKMFVFLLMAAFAVNARAVDVPNVVIYMHNGLTTDGKMGCVLVAFDRHWKWMVQLLPGKPLVGWLLSLQLP